MHFAALIFMNIQNKDLFVFTSHIWWLTENFAHPCYFGVFIDPAPEKNNGQHNKMSTMQVAARR